MQGSFRPVKKGIIFKDSEAAHLHSSILYRYDRRKYDRKNRDRQKWDDFPEPMCCSYSKCKAVNQPFQDQCCLNWYSPKVTQEFQKYYNHKVAKHPSNVHKARIKLLTQAKTIQIEGSQMILKATWPECFQTLIGMGSAIVGLQIKVLCNGLCKFKNNST